MGFRVRLAADFIKRVLVHCDQMDWVDSSMQGVSRRPLDRVGGEIARAKCAPGSHFPAHRHSGGEGSIVLEGVSQDEHGGYSAGSYCRNPSQSSHAPKSTLGCVIFVKLFA